jgi:hypothetical protein
VRRGSCSDSPVEEEEDVLEMMGDTAAVALAEEEVVAILSEGSTIAADLRDER